MKVGDITMMQEEAEEVFRVFAEEAKQEVEDPVDPVPRFDAPAYASWVARNVAQTPPSVYRVLKWYQEQHDAMTARITELETQLKEKIS